MKPSNIQVSRYELSIDCKSSPETDQRQGLHKYVGLIRDRFEKVEELEKGVLYALTSQERTIAAGIDHIQVLERELSEDLQTSAFAFTRPAVVLTATVLVCFPEPVVSRLSWADAHQPLRKLVAKDLRIIPGVLWGHGYALQLPPYPDPRPNLPLIAGCTCTMTDPEDLVRRWRNLSSGLTRLVSWTYVAQGGDNGGSV
jgi:hypothetical protein